MLVSSNRESLAFKKIFFITLVLIIVFLILVNYFLIPFLKIESENIVEIITSVINNIISLAITSIGASIAYLAFTPKKLRESELEIINPNDLRQELKSLITNTNYLKYSGHTARWNRSTSLDYLIQEANTEKRNKEIELIILDPTDDFSCNYYSSFGHSKREKGNSINDLKDIKIELVSTILISLIKNNNPFINIRIYLTKSVSLFRFDITENGCILTKPYSDEPALFFKYGSFFYKSYLEEYRIIRDQSRELNISKQHPKVDLSNISTILDGLELQNLGFDERDLKKICANIKSNKSPY